MEEVKFTDKEIHVLYDVLLGGEPRNRNEKRVLKIAFEKIERADDRMHKRLHHEK